MSIASLTHSPSWLAAGWTMVHLAWVGVLIGLVAASGRRMLAKATPEARYGFALACFLAFGVSTFPIFASCRDPDARIATKNLDRKLSDVPPASGSPTVDPYPSRLPPPSPSANVPRRASRPGLDAWVAWLPWAWLSGSLGSLAALATGLVGVERLRRSSRAADEAGEVARACRRLAGSLGIARRVGVAACDRLATPVLIGVVRPLILLPTAAFDSWALGQVEMALLHELAHLRRWDNHVNLIQRGVEALLFFHPVAWWLSAWVRLERESCCDRMVVARTGRARPYAEMLAGLAGPGPGRESVGSRAGLGMADRQVTTRVRRILNLEDRPMRISPPEGCALLAVAIVAALTLGGARGGPVPAGGEPGEAVRLALREAAASAASADLADADNIRVRALENIAKAQLKVGDRDGALATLARASEGVDRVELRGKYAGRIHDLIEVAALRGEAGDAGPALESLGRIASLVGKIPAGPGGDGPMIRAMLVARVADERAKLGDLDAARADYARLTPEIRAIAGPDRPGLLETLGAGLIRAGDAAGGRALIDEARASAATLPDAAARGRASALVAGALGEAGDVAAAIGLARSLREPRQEIRALEAIVAGLAEHNPDDPTPWFDPNGIKLVVGAIGLRPKDREAARLGLPAVARAVAATAAPGPTRARSLSRIAHLQAMAGDIPGARATADLIPAIRRADSPGPPDGFYEAVRPGTLAIVAALAAWGSDPLASADLFRLATEAARGIGADDQAIFARLILAREMLASARDDEARATLREAASLALRQPEPLRSRALSAIATGLARTGDPAEASALAAAIRVYPGLEKNAALGQIADACEKAGDREGADRAIREALRCVESKAPENPAMGPKVDPKQSFTQAGFIDPELEVAPAMVAFTKGYLPALLRLRLGDLEGAIATARALPAGRRDNVLAQVVAELARRGDLKPALDLAATIASPESRLAAIEQAAVAVRDRAR